MYAINYQCFFNLHDCTFKLFSVWKIIRNYFYLRFFKKKTSELMELAVVILVIPRLTFTCSNSAIEKGVKYVQS